MPAARSILPMTRADWQRHFGPRFAQLSEAKRRFDPANLLTPGYAIFQGKLCGSRLENCPPLPRTDASVHVVRQTAFMMRPLSPSRRLSGRTSRALAAGIGIVLGLVLIEGTSRVLESGPEPARGLDLTLQPYMMFSANGYASNMVWRNRETNTDIPSRVRFNNLGFAEAGDFSFPVDDAFVKTFGKKPDEKLVLITGASVIQGVGATANENTIAGQLQRALNETQSRQRYRVINLGMGGWNAYQEFVGLSLFGAPLRPDWVIVMDGANDGSLVCAQGTGPGNPREWPKLLYLTGGGQRAPYQGPVLQWLVTHTAAARLVTGQSKPAPNNPIGQVFVDDDEPNPQFRIKLRGLTVADLDRQVAFYLQAQRNIVELFSSANVLLSTEPLLHDNSVTDAYRAAFAFSPSPAEVARDKRRLGAELDAYMAKAKDTRCDSTLDLPALGYFMARSALHLEQAVAEWSARPSDRHVLYTNVEGLFPDRYGMRLPNFIDNAHLTDLGQRRIAEFFAGYILNADLGVPFDPKQASEGVLADSIRRRIAGSVAIDGPPARAPGKVILEQGHADGLSVTQVKPDVLRLEEEPRTGFHQITWSGVAVNPNEEAVVAVEARFDEVDVVRLEIRDASGSYGWSDVDLGTQSLKAGGSISNAFIEDLGQGWRRVSLTVPFKSGVASIAVALMSVDGKATEYPGAGRSMAITQPVVASAGARMGGQ
jgi:lysophospholipase L1-like esterase